MISVKKNFPLIVKTALVMMLGTGLLFSACINDPVDLDYFNDIDMVKGGEKPCPPVVDNLAVTDAGSSRFIITITFSDPVETGVDCTDEAGETLYYKAFASTVDPMSVTDSIFYDMYYYLGYTQTVGDADTPLLYVPDPITCYFWMTVWDGGRESDHSNVMSIDIP